VSERHSRRDVLSRGAAALGAVGLSSLAGCSGVVDRFDGDDEGPAYDAAALRAVPPEEWFKVPERHPFEVPGSITAGHRSRTAELLSEVPAEPDVPNGVVAETLGEEHASVTEESEREPEDGMGPLERIRRRRGTRTDAAELHGSYLAAVDEVDPEAVASRRERLRDALHNFRRGWDYMAADPVEAVAVHRHVESRLAEWERSTEAWPDLPADPQAAPFRAGDVFGRLERATATRVEAGTLLIAYLDPLADPVSHRATVTGATYRLHRRVRRGWRPDEDLDVTNAPFERDIEETLAGSLFSEALWRARSAADGVDRAVESDRFATAVVEATAAWASVAAFRTVREGIEAEAYGTVESTDAVGERRSAAVAALEDALSGSSELLRPPVVAPAADAVADADGRLDRSDGHEYDVRDAVAGYRWAAAYADAVDDALAETEAALNAAAR
jgi:hypothetical protein